MRKNPADAHWGRVRVSRGRTGSLSGKTSRSQLRGDRLLYRPPAALARPSKAHQRCLRADTKQSRWEDSPDSCCCFSSSPAVFSQRHFLSTFHLFRDTQTTGEMKLGLNYIHHITPGNLDLVSRIKSPRSEGVSERQFSPDPLINFGYIAFMAAMGLDLVYKITRSLSYFDEVE